MKARPIPFSGPMVRALMDGRKTQVRRIVKSNERLDTFDLFGIGETSAAGKNRGFCATFRAPASRWIGPDKPWHTLVRCPYGKPGDVLWVRENGWERPVRTPRMMRDGADTWLPYEYDDDGYSREQLKAWGWKRRPSIHMPRWASRITLEIGSIRVERLQGISEEDARAEGIELVRTEGGTRWWRNYLDDGRGNLMFPSESFRTLWESINGIGSWVADPWVWVVEFRPHLMNIDQFLKQREAA